MMVQDKQLVGMREAGEAVGVTEQTVRYWARVHKISVYRLPLGRQKLVDLQEIKRLMETLIVEPAEEYDSGQTGQQEP